MADVRQGIGDLGRLGLQRVQLRMGPALDSSARLGVPQDALPDLPREVQAPAVVLQDLHHADALPVVAEAARVQLRQRRLAQMPERRVAQIVAHADGLRQVLVQVQGPGHRSGDQGDLHGMSQPG